MAGGGAAMTDAWDGRPQNPERDGWHWVAWAGNAPDPTFWTPHGPERRGPCWHWDDDWMGPGWVCSNATYLGPCLTPAEVAAQVAAAVIAEREACAALCQEDCYENMRQRPAPSGGDALQAAIKTQVEDVLLHTLHPEFGSIWAPDGEATKAYQDGRREGIEAAAARIDAISVAIMDGTHAPNSMSRCVVTSGDCAAAIRALLPAPDAALARDFAAWTEGESDG